MAKVEINASMDSSPTELYLPQSLSYPIKVVSLDATPQSDIQRGTRLLSYSFIYIPSTPDPKPQTRFGTWDSAIQGTLKSWKIKPGDVISEKKARITPALVLIEPCKHGMQLGGLCVLCGKDMTKYVNIGPSLRFLSFYLHSTKVSTIQVSQMPLVRLSR